MLRVVWPAPVMSWKYRLGSVCSNRYTIGLKLPLRWPWKLSRSAAIPDHSGDDRLVPPMPNHPGVGWLLLNVPQTLFGVLELPVQYSAYGVYWSALAEMSGTCRHRVPFVANAHWVVPLPVVTKELITPGPAWYHGRPQKLLDPPPPAPVVVHQSSPVSPPSSALSLQRLSTFQTLSTPAL